MLYKRSLQTPKTHHKSINNLSSGVELYLHKFKGSLIGSGSIKPIQGFCLAPNQTGASFRKKIGCFSYNFDKNCVRCGLIETNDHLYFNCDFARAVFSSFEPCCSICYLFIQPSPFRLYPRPFGTLGFQKSRLYEMTSEKKQILPHSPPDPDKLPGEWRNYLFHEENLNRNEAPAPIQLVGFDGKYGFVPRVL
jgi:hypothetical protein